MQPEAPKKKPPHMNGTQVAGSEAVQPLRPHTLRYILIPRPTSLSVRSVGNVGPGSFAVEFGDFIRSTESICSNAGYADRNVAAVLSASSKMMVNPGRMPGNKKARTRATSVDALHQSFPSQILRGALTGARLPGHLHVLKKRPRSRSKVRVMVRSGIG